MPLSDLGPPGLFLLPLDTTGTSELVEAPPPALGPTPDGWTVRTQLTVNMETDAGTDVTLKFVPWSPVLLVKGPDDALLITGPDEAAAGVGVTQPSETKALLPLPEPTMPSTALVSVSTFMVVMTVGRPLVSIVSVVHWVTTMVVRDGVASCGIPFEVLVPEAPSKPEERAAGAVTVMV